MEHIQLWHTTQIDTETLKDQFKEGEINSLTESGFFALKTCQRVILISRENSKSEKLNNSKFFEKLNGPEAYQFILETICGLKSRLLGETEIVGQFKESFENYLKSPNRDPRMIKIFHKVFMDSKKVRSEHLQKIGLLSYCGLTKNLINGHFPEKGLCQKSIPIAILGSGKLAGDLIKVLNRNYNIHLHARNEESISQLTNKYSIEAVNRVDQDDLLSKQIIVNTIGTDRKLFFNDFFTDWKRKHFCQNMKQDTSMFIDLSSPSVIDTSYGKLEAVYRLDDLFTLAQTMHAEKEQKLSEALNAITHITAKRHAHFSPSSVNSWEGIQLA